MKTTTAIDKARLSLLLNELRLPAIKVMWPGFAEQADREGWPAARFLATVAEHELAERDWRRIERHMAEARLLPGKTLDSFEFEAVPMLSKAQVMAISAGDSWLESGANCCCSDHPVAARAIWPRQSGWRWSRTAGRCCSPEPPISSRNCNWRDANLAWKPPLPSSTSSFC